MCAIAPIKWRKVLACRVNLQGTKWFVPHMTTNGRRDWTRCSIGEKCFIYWGSGFILCRHEGAKHNFEAFSINRLPVGFQWQAVWEQQRFRISVCCFVDCTLSSAHDRSFLRLLFSEETNSCRKHWWAYLLLVLCTVDGNCTSTWQRLQTNVPFLGCYWLDCISHQSML